ncbi:MAG TPA: hypothetical protein V6D10_02620 [Trichocoleus sp.]
MTVSVPNKWQGTERRSMTSSRDRGWDEAIKLVQASHIHALHRG